MGTKRMVIVNTANHPWAVIDSAQLAATWSDVSIEELYFSPTKEPFWGDTNAEPVQVMPDEDLLLSKLVAMDPDSVYLRVSPLLGVLLVFAIALLVNSSDLLAFRLSFGIESDQIWELYALGLRAFEDNPVTGSGVGCFPQIFKIYRDLNIPSTNFVRAHNDFLELSIALCMAAFANE